MKACYKKVKAAIAVNKPTRPRPPSSSSSPSTSTAHTNQPGTTGQNSANNNKPLPSALQIRHAKCFLQQNPHQLKNVRGTGHVHKKMSRRSPGPGEVKKTGTTTGVRGQNFVPGSLAIAQIRALPLNVCHIRGDHESRASYIINCKQVRSKASSSLIHSRSRSLSPGILRSTPTTQLQSPNLVRSVSSCCERSKKRERKNGNTRTPKSMIPIRVSFTGTTGTTNRKKLDEQERCSGKPFPLQIKLTDEDDLAEYQRRKKAADSLSAHNQFNGGSSSNKPPSKSRLILQALVGMDIQSRRAAKAKQQQQLQQQEQQQQLQRISSPVMSFPRQQLQPQPKFLFRRPLSSASSVQSEPQGPRGFMTRQTSGGNSSVLFDDVDDGIMSEAETSSTGFRRGGKARSSLPVVRTPSKTLERPLGLVFLQYRSETKRALLPNEITSMDTVKALFVRSFPKQLTLEYLDAMQAKIYIHDNGKDMFYELEDLRDIRDRSVLRLFEPNINGNGAVPSWDQDQSYFSEPEFDSDFQHQHIHKSKGNKSPYLPPYAYPIGATLPRGRPYSPHVAAPIKPVQTPTNSVTGNSTLPPPKPQRNSTPTYSLVKRPSGVSPSANLVYSPPRSGSVQDRSSSFPPPGSHYGDGRVGNPTDLYANADRGGYISSPERARYINAEDPYYNYPPPSRSGSITPVIIDEEARFRMEHMERQLANLTGLVQKALTPAPPPVPVPVPRHHSSTLPRTVGATNYSLVPQRDYIPTRDFRDDIDKNSSSSSASLPDERPPPPEKITAHPKFGKEKSVSFSDDQPDIAKQHSPTHHAVEKPTKPAIKSSTLPRMSQDRIVPVQPRQHHHPSHQPQQPPTPVLQQQRSLPLVQPTHPYEKQYLAYSTRVELSPEMYNQLRNLQKKAKELKSDMRILRRNVQAQAHAVRETLRDTFLRFKVVALAGSDQWMSGDPERARLKKDEELYKQEMIKLDKDLCELETTVEELRSHVINKRTRVNMSDVENMALILSKSSKSVADLKARFPVLQENIKSQLTNEMDRMVTEERFMKDEPDRLETALRRCKKLTGTLVTLKRLASVQEQRLPSFESTRSLPSPAPSTPTEKSMNRSPVTGPVYSSTRYVMVSTTNNNNDAGSGGGPESQLDALLDELSAQQQQHIISSPPPQTNTQRNRLNPPDPPKRLPSYPSTESGGSPVRHPPLPPKPTKIPPPPPPRTSSKSPLISPGHLGLGLSTVDSESSESLNSQDGIGTEKLSLRHQELLRKQRQLQDQYMRLQRLQDTGLKKTGSETNIGGKLTMSISNTRETSNGGSMTNLAMANETDIL